MKENSKWVEPDPKKIIKRLNQFILARRKKQIPLPVISVNTQR